MLADHQIELRRARTGDGRVEWFVGAMMIRLEAKSLETVALSASLEDVEIAPVSYPITLRAARDVARDVAAVIDLPDADR